MTVTKASLEHTAMKVRPLTLPLPGSGRGVCIVSVETSAGFPLRLGSKTEVCLIYEITDASEPSHLFKKFWNLNSLGGPPFCRSVFPMPTEQLSM